MLSLRPLDDLLALIADHQLAPHRRLAQRALAHEMTALAHGEDAARTADEAADVLFGGDPTTASAAALEAVAREVPSSRMTPAQLDDVVEVLVATELASSKSDARRTLEGSGYRCNGATLDANAQLSGLEPLHGRFLLLQRGKKSHHLVEVFS
jgi:tyrosyl-tRNA synthetase